MDFKALMSKEISKKLSVSSQSSPSKPQYLKRSEKESQRQAEYLASQEAIQRERELKISQKRKLEEEEAESNRIRDEKRRRLADESRKRREEEDELKELARRKRLGLPELPPAESGADGSKLAEGDEDIPEDELNAKFRALGEPVQLFGEGPKHRIRRYQRLMSKLALSTGPIPTSLVLVPEEEMKVPLSVPSDEAGRKYLFRQLASYFTLVLSEWALAMDQRPESVKESFQGKAAFNTMVQTRENMRPLFRRFEHGEVEEGILEPILGIVKAAQERRYVDANDGYLTLSIGKAAWPIGVTMVGIHERSAREKLHESDKGAAHIMSDEVTRKFLQSIKRCLSFAQTRWPPADHLQLMG
ncbi:MAG: mRNA splicing protein prp18 [Trizodia sp. TS-e1964]|nr:MAG: mRNA splicing protein prp18 [Trizodia sp. TS-e1964]